MEKFESTTAYKKGRTGESIVISKLINEGFQIRDFTDYENNKYKQKKGYDIEIFNEKTKDWDRIDIKTNVKGTFTFLEVVKSYSGNLGWFYTSTADYIITYDLERNQAYIYSLAEMRNYVHKRKNDLKIVGKNKDLFMISLSNHLIKKIL